jgi:FG-GAP-like repeat
MRSKVLVGGLALLLALPRMAIAQAGAPVFTLVQEIANPIAVQGLAWADANGDGRVDLTISGTDFVGQQIFETRLYRQQNNGQFALVPGFLRTYANGHLAWADVDHDGDLDLGVGGCPQQPALGCGNWLQKQVNGVMLPPTPLAPAALIDNNDFAWQDVDGDGNIDAVATLYGANLQVLYGNGLGQFFDAELVLPNFITSGSVFLGDVDRDGDLDALRTGGAINISGVIYTLPTFFRNQGGRTFVAQQTFPLTGFVEQRNGASMSDIDCDGDQDISMWFTWIDSPPSIFHWLQNNGPGPLTVRDMTGNEETITLGLAAYLDYDRDGYMDYISFTSPTCSNGQGFCRMTTLFKHLGNGQYQQFPLAGIYAPDQSFTGYSAFDFDGDGDSDLLVEGREPISDNRGLPPSHIYLYRNDTPRAPVACRLGVVGPAVYQSVPSATAKHHALLAILITLIGGAVLWNRR